MGITILVNCTRFIQLFRDLFYAVKFDSLEGQNM